MNLRQPLPSSNRVWLTLSAVLFLACWFLRGGKGGNEPFWNMWWIFLRQDFQCSVLEIAVALLMFSVIFGAVALVLGWLLQFPVCAVLKRFQHSQMQ